jgi:hypothetical protein
MSVSPTISVTTKARPNHWLVTAALVVAAAAVTVVITLSFTGGSSQTKPVTSAIPSASAAQDAARVPSIMQLTPAQLAAGGYGVGYGLPTTQTGPTLARVLASMSPQTRRYTEAIMAQTFAQLAAGGAGAP